VPRCVIAPITLSEDPDFMVALSDVEEPSDKQSVIESLGWLIEHRKLKLLLRLEKLHKLQDLPSDVHERSDKHEAIVV
jgi:hypothetical protein